ncbi:hypothetical protein EDD21DRAFT_418707 [Dissophora ornata]|nr:hypothetical protein EDD21DRAFT_418707 [Dissophora ornata]
MAFQCETCEIKGPNGVEASIWHSLETTTSMSPWLDGAKDFSAVTAEVKMYFGLSEIKAEVFVQGEKYTTTLQFDGGNSY